LPIALLTQAHAMFVKLKQFSNGPSASFSMLYKRRVSNT
jgi:hypothetical protein